jgi:hypothetical protein
MPVRKATRAGRIAPALAVMLSLSACATEKPAELAASFRPPPGAWLSRAQKTVPAGARACVVRLGKVSDSVDDPHVLGSIGGRPIHAADLDAWIRSGFGALRGDARLEVVDAADSGNAVVVDLEVLKAYTLSLTTEKSTNLVFRARFSGAGGNDAEQVYRGVDTAVNWNSGEGETQTSFDRALGQVLDQLDRDIVARCVAET